MRDKRLLLIVGFALLTGCRDSSEPRTYRQVDREQLISVATNTEVNPEQVGQWPNWRGPQFDGISHETDWTWQWPADGPPVLWQRSVGTGYSSCAIVGGALYTMGRRGNQEAVFCLDAETGDERWSFLYDGELVNNMNAGGPGATPTVEGDKVYTMGREGQLHCLSAADGTEIWSKMLQQNLDVDLPDWGFTCSPLIVDDKVVVDGGRIVAYDRQTGRRLWQTNKRPAGYGSPAVFQHDGETLVAVLDNDGLTIVQAADGEERAHFPWQTNYDTNSTTPIVVGDTIFISTGYKQGCALLQWVGDDLAPVYESGAMANHFNNCVVWDGYLYGMHGNSSSARNIKLTCMDYATGQVLWTQRGFGCGSLMLADGKLIILSDEGQLAIAEATPDGFKELASAKVLGGRCWTVPVLAGGRIFCRNDEGDLVCVDVRRDS